MDIILPRREMIRVCLGAIGGVAIGRVLTACVGYDYGEPYGPPLVVTRSEHGDRLYVFLHYRRNLGYTSKSEGPFITSFDGKVGGWEFLINGEDPLGDQEVGTHRYRVSEGDMVQPCFREFASAEKRSEALESMPMNPAEADIMEEIERS